MTMKQFERDRPTRISEACRQGARNEAVCLDSHLIFSGRTEVLIRHGEHMYRLRKTRQGKLILNK